MNQHGHTALWACTSAGTCAASFLAIGIPILQVIALTVSILAGIKALLGKKDK
jgi:hypothetical protein